MEPYIKIFIVGLVLLTVLLIAGLLLSGSSGERHDKELNNKWPPGGDV